MKWNEGIRDVCDGASIGITFIHSYDCMKGAIHSLHFVVCTVLGFRYRHFRYRFVVRGVECMAEGNSI